MGCIQSHVADESLLRPSLPVIYEDPHWGSIYMSTDLSRYIRTECIGITALQVHRFMQQFPQLTYEIGKKDLAYRRIYNSPNHIRFCMNPTSPDTEKVLLVIYG
jgi:hypothetical protein